MRKLAVLVVAVVAVVATTAGCSSSGSTSTSSSSPTSGSAGGGGGSTAPTSTSGVVAQAKAAVATLEAGNDSAPPTTGPAPAKGKDVWIVSCGQTTSCGTISAGAQAAAKVLGWSTHVCDGKLDADNAFVTCMGQAIAAKADGILDVGIDCALIKQQLASAKSANIPVVGDVVFDCGDNLPQSAGPNLFTSQVSPSTTYPTSGDGTKAAQVAYANYLIANTNGAAKVLDFSFTGETIGVLSEAAFQAAMKPCTGCTVYPVPFTLQQITPNSLKTLFQASYLKHQDANAVTAFAATIFEVGLGAAVTAAGKNIISAAGAGSEPSAMDLLRSGGLTVFAAADLTWYGWAGMDTMNRAFAGQPAAPEGIGLRLITKNSTGIGTSGPYKSPVDYSTAYRKLWTGK